MDLKCGCGQEFKAPDGTQEAECPACGRTVRAAGDWLSALEDVELELDVEEAPSPPAEETPAASPTPAAPPSAPAPAGPSVPRRSGPTPKREEPQRAEPPGLLGLLVLARDEPFVLLDFLRRGLHGPRLLTELVVSTGALALVWSFVAANLAGTPGMPAAAGRFVQFIAELAVACIMLALLTVLLKRDAHERPNPFGVVEAVVLTRLLGLALAVPIGIAVAILFRSPEAASAMAAAPALNAAQYHSPPSLRCRRFRRPDGLHHGPAQPRLPALADRQRCGQLRRLRPGAQGLSRSRIPRRAPSIPSSKTTAAPARAGSIRSA